MKNKMPLDGLGLGHDSGSVHCDMLKMLCFRTAWGGKTEEQVIIDKQTCPLSPLPFDSIQFVSFREKSDGWKMYRMVIIVRNKF